MSLCRRGDGTRREPVGDTPRLHIGMGKQRAKKAQTLDDLGGKASNVFFVRTDAVAALPQSISHSKLKQAFDWELAPQWPLITGDNAAVILRHIGSACTADAAAGRDPPRPGGIRLGRAAVTRALRRRELRAVILARDSGPPILYTHLAALAQDCGAPACLLACSSAQLGQPFGLLRASTVGLHASHFGEDHELVALLRRAGREQQPGGPLPWLDAVRGALAQPQVDASGTGNVTRVDHDLACGTADGAMVMVPDADAIEK